MTTVALLLYTGLLVTAFGVRSMLHKRRTGHSGVVGLRGRVGSVEWWGGVLFLAAVVLGLLAPVADLVWAVARVDVLDGVVAHAVGLALALAGWAGVLLAQASMGASWRVGVDAAERTPLVTDGPFAIVRNPVFAAMVPAAAGIALLVPSAISLAALAALVVAVELQVRAVEEPYLRRTHGDAYRRYAARVGRFVPRPGRAS